MKNLKKLVTQGYTNSEIARELNKSLRTIILYRSKLNLPTNKTIKKLLKDNTNFKEEFINKYNEVKSLKEMLSFVQNHNLFLRTKINLQRLGEIRNFYDLKHKMFENTYNSDYDRIRGYMIRNTKFTSKRRNINFNLNYYDFEIPEYCPLLNIKLTYSNESNGNDMTHASLDRIDNNKGYIKGNVIVISRLANCMKNEANFEQLETFSINIIKLINFYKKQGALGSITDVFDNFSPKLSLDS